jgi:lipid II:glycine glycyltransferase (peptidoglycan interpeptide bridge formation enzyme)
LDRAISQFARRFSHVTLTGSPYSNVHVLSDTWSSSERHTYLLSIGDLRGLWRSLASEVRNRIRKAERMGVTVRPFSGRPDFHTQFRGVFGQKGGSVPFTEGSFTRFVQQVEELGIGQVYEARAGSGELCAACLIVYDRRRAYYSLAASDEQLRKTGAASLLVWHVLQELSSKAGEFDFGGANVPEVARFKKKFRGRLVSYLEFDHFRSWPERLVLQARERFRAVG